MAAALHPACAILAGAFSYPAPGRLDNLKQGAAAWPPAEPGRDAFGRFVAAVERLSLGEWEELHTRTLDLNPPAAPYVGYQTWGDSYHRGAFMAKMNRALAEAAVDREGELPDHLAPCLRYLAVATDPLPELLEVFGPALERILAALREAEPANPYAHLLQAAQAATEGLRKEAA